MSTPRIKAPADRPVAHYHCVSRIVDRRFIFEVPQKEHFVGLMRECEAFCGVRILTYCVMSNHFHILVEVPKRPQAEQLPTAEQVIERLGVLSGHQDVGLVRQRFEMYRTTQDREGEAVYLASFHARMWDVSEFIRTLKQRFTMWYNVRKGRKGTLWESRFKSVLVEGAGPALAAMAAYIDLNPVRAGITKDPKDYRWCGYAEAISGRRGAKLAIQSLVTALQLGREEPPGRSLEVYRAWVFMEGNEERESLDSSGRPVRGAISREAVLQVLEQRGQLSMVEYLRCRVRYFSDGAVFGSREFVEGIFRAHRGMFGARRRNGARKVKGVSEGSLYALRDLRVDVFG